MNFSGLSLGFAVLLLVQLAARAQNNCNMNVGLTNGNTCFSESPCRAGPGHCCVWNDSVPVNNDPNSLLAPNGTPLGFVSYPLPGADSSADAPCVRVPYPAEAVGRTSFMVFGIESVGSICVRETGNVDSEPACGDSQITFCMRTQVTNVERFVELDIFCQDSCEAGDTVFRMRPFIFIFENDVEDFCGSTNSTVAFPSSLIVPPDFTNAPPSMATTDGATPLTSPHLYTLLVLSALLAKICSL